MPICFANAKSRLVGVRRSFAKARVQPFSAADLAMADTPSNRKSCTRNGEPLNDPGLDIFAYDEWYLGDDDKEHPMIPDDALILASTRARTVRCLSKKSRTDFFTI
uniref:Uncharacterized protein n=1 Tax=Candidatus Kentrum eta TaxID=2126337 RepID=A0A450UJ40_9GAMM|nr:MAG: hypothetical protein BECKH772A_GA0070896_1003228 [Candidatus Kentron sp. H]VFJ92538.1 MAG: hypothetical protein BECKH772B_GA0070898_100316 [Candidatus Kentron sp. H]VFJ99417.1 MAG: hypothetical protein BECKH772C_GA0070978_1003129 [Candidatus Kentron sp. H]